MKFIRQLQALFRKEKLDTEMAEEMRLHVEMQTERNIAMGMKPWDAHYAALRQFGNVASIQEQARAQRGWVWLEQLGQDLRFGARQLRKSPGFTAVAVVSLAIGIGLNTAVFSIINTIFYQTIRGVPEPDRVLIFNDGGASPAGYRLLREQAVGMAALTASRSVNVTIEADGRDLRGRAAAVAADYFSVLGAVPQQGRFFLAPTGVAAENHAEPEIVIPFSFWEKQLARDPGVLGRVLRVNGVSLTVVGVAAPDFHGPGPEGPVMWVPLGLLPSLTQRFGSPPPEEVGLIGRLRPGVSLGQAQAALTTIAASAPEVFGQSRPRLSLGREDWRGEASPEKRIELMLVTTVPLLVVGCLLWIACSNVGNLLLARAVQRRKEIAIRIAAGASRLRLVRMLMVESLLLALLGGASGLWMSRLTLDFVFATLSEFGALSVQIDGRVLLYTAAVCVVAAVLFGLIPALQASKTDVNGALKGDNEQPPFRGARLRTILLASQIASSVALLVVAGTYVKTLVTSAYVGPQARLLDHLVAAQLPAQRDSTSPTEFHRTILTQIQALPGIEAAAVVEPGSPPSIFNRPGEPTQEKGKEVRIQQQRIDGNYARVVGLTLREGAMLSATSGSGLREAIVNEAMVRTIWPQGDVLGARFDLNGEPFVVLGVVADGAKSPMAYTQLPATAPRLGLLIRARGEAEETVPLVTGVLRRHATANEFIHVAPLREIAFRFVSVMAQLGAYIGGLALVLAAAGVYASMSFSTGQRTHEIGVRMALGASRRAVLALVLRGGLKVIGGGAAAGLVLALIGLRLLIGLTGGGGSGFDIVAIVSVIAFFAAVAATACLVPAWRGARVNPVEALRAE